MCCVCTLGALCWRGFTETFHIQIHIKDAVMMIVDTAVLDIVFIYLISPLFKQIGQLGTYFHLQ